MRLRKGRREPGDLIWATNMGRMEPGKSHLMHFTSRVELMTNLGAYKGRMKLGICMSVLRLSDLLLKMLPESPE